MDTALYKWFIITIYYYISQAIFPRFEKPRAQRSHIWHGSIHRAFAPQIIIVYSKNMTVAKQSVSRSYYGSVTFSPSVGNQASGRKQLTNNMYLFIRPLTIKRAQFSE